MAWKRGASAAVLAALITGAAGSALAQSTGEASLGHLSYHLIDLAPDDGIAPSLTLSSKLINGFAEQSDLSGNQTAYVTLDGFGTKSYTNHDGSGRIEIQNDLVSALTQSASGTGASLATRIFDFTLSPNTEVIFSADADVSASASGGTSDFAQAVALLYGEIDQGPDAWLTFNSQAEVLTGSEHVTLSAAANAGSDWTHGTIGILANTYGTSSAPPVPEPASAGMLGLGLGIVAAVLRRRRVVTVPA